MHRRIASFLLAFLFLCSISSAEIITLKTGETVRGRIIERDVDGILVFSGYGIPLKYSMSEIEKIDVDRSVAELSKDNIQDFYGVKYDTSSLGSGFDVSGLIIFLAEIANTFDISIQGVKVLDRGVVWDLARIATTSSFNKSKNKEAEPKNILVISPDLAYNPSRIIKILKREPLTEKEIMTDKIEQARKDSLTSFFKDGIKAEDKDSLPARIAGGAANMIEGLSNVVNKKGKGHNKLRIYNYYLSFEEVFGEDKPVELVQNKDEITPSSDMPSKEEGKEEIKKTFFDDGSVSGEYSYKDGKLNGVSKEYFKKGNLRAEIEYKNNERTGKYKEYYENGNIMYVEPYKNGKINGVAKEYLENGTLVGEFTYKDGLLNGLSREFYDSGKLKSETYYKNDKKNGKMSVYYEGGALFKEVSYKDDKENGDYREFFENGNEKIFMQLKDGIRINEFKEYFQDGTLAYVETYKNGIVDGIAKEYYETGKIHIETVYKDGEIMKQDVFDESGDMM